MLYVFRLRFFLSEKVHLMCYRICVRALTAIITYHNRYNIFNIQQKYQLPRRQFNLFNTWCIVASFGTGYLLACHQVVCLCLKFQREQTKEWRYLCGQSHDTH